MTPRIMVVLAFALVLTVVSLTLSGWALKERFEEANARRTQQQQVNELMRRQALETCLEIEKLKLAQRERALDAYRNSGRDLRLLGIERTAAVERAIEENRDAVLRRFRPEPCPRPARRKR